MIFFRFISSIFLLSFFFGGGKILAQDVTIPLEPTLSYVTVDTLNNNVEIFWKKSTSKDVASYNLYYEIQTVNGYESLIFTSVPGSVTNFTDTSSLAGEKSIHYSISAVDTSGNESTLTPMHSTIHATINYYPCESKIILHWNKYMGWGTNIGGGYRINARRGNDNFQEIAVKDTDTDSLVIYKFGSDETILENNQYYFYVEGLQNDKLLVSSSEIASEYTLMPTAPQDFYLDNVSVTDSRTVDVRFRYSDALSIDSFALFRSNQEFSEFSKVKTFQNTNSSPQIIQDSIFTGVNRFFYRIGALNKCRVVINSATTNLGTNILLSGTDSIIEMKHNSVLTWTSYHDFPMGIAYYEIYRLDTSNDTLLSVATVGALDTSFTTDLSVIYGQGYTGKITYLVKAVENGENEAYSNFCNIDLKSEIWMPNAFTPNSDGENDVFIPFFYLVPNKYLLQIYDRFGTIIYSSVNPKVGWDGRISGSNFASEGVYIYHVQYTSFNGQPVNMTGSVTVFYP